jgi:hypothetical protein
MYTGCFGYSRVCTLQDYFMPAYIHGLSLDNPRTHEAALFGRACPLKNKKRCTMKELKCRRDTFVLTWSEQKFVSSSEDPGINFFSKRDFFYLLVNFQITMVKMSCQLLFVEFFGPFCHFFYPLSHFFLAWKSFNSILEFLIGCYDTLFLLVW